MAAWAFAFLLLRIFAVSGYDWDTAFLVSTTLGLDDGLALMFGSLMANYLLTAALLVGVLPLLIAASVWGTGEHRRVLMLLAVLGVVALAALSTSYRLWWLPVACGVVLALFASVRLLPVDNPVHRTVVRVLARVGWVTGLASLLVAAFVQIPWVPQEQIETADGTITGYVLSVDSGYLNVLTEDQEFQIVLSTDVLSRK